MYLIKKIEIGNFRSNYDVEIDEAFDVNVISGATHVGKSPLIKALNLFFNYQESSVNFVSRYQ